MNTAAASVISVSAELPPILYRIRKTSAFLRKLSLNAEKNWHQNSGAKRRDDRSGLESVCVEAMAGSLCQRIVTDTSLARWVATGRAAARTAMARRTRFQ